MENETQVIEITPKNMYLPICITQLVCVAVILIAVVIIKFFFSNSYQSLKEWCNNNFFVHTTVSENIDEDSSSEI